MQVLIIFHDPSHSLLTLPSKTYEVQAWESHTFGFLELVYEDGISEYISFASIFSFKPSAPSRSDGVHDRLLAKFGLKTESAALQ